nr:nucleotide exchange factor GrpE [Anaerolineae bacterium]
MSKNQHDDELDKSDTEHKPAPAQEGEAETEQVIDAVSAFEEERDVEQILAELEAQAAEYLDGWQRARAELANYKKRMERERETLANTLRGDVILALLPVLDDFDLAMNSQSDDIASLEWAGGIALIYRKLQNLLTEFNVTEIEALGQPFAPMMHDAVMQREEPGVESGTVVEVIRKGYLIGEKVLRPSMVVVAA